MWRYKRIISAGGCWRHGWWRETDSLWSIYSSIASPTQPVTTPPSFLNIHCFLHIAPLPISRQSNCLLLLWQLAPHQCAGSSHVGGWGKWFEGMFGADGRRMDDSTESLHCMCVCVWEKGRVINMLHTPGRIFHYANVLQRFLKTPLTGSSHRSKSLLQSVESLY